MNQPNITINTFENLNKLPNKPKSGEVAFVTDTNQMYMYNDAAEQWCPIDNNIQMSLYDINKQVIYSLPDMTEDEIINARQLIYDFVNTETQKYYMLLCKELDYYTIFTRWAGEEDIGQAIFECLYNVGQLKAINLTENQDAIEFWFIRDNEVYAAYLFNYDMGVIECQ